MSRDPRNAGVVQSKLPSPQTPTQTFTTLPSAEHTPAVTSAASARPSYLPTHSPFQSPSGNHTGLPGQPETGGGNNHLNAIIGGAIGGTVLLIATGLAWVYRNSIGRFFDRGTTRRNRAAAADRAAAPHHSQRASTILVSPVLTATNEAELAAVMPEKPRHPSAIVNYADSRPVGPGNSAGEPRVA